MTNGEHRIQEIMLPPGHVLHRVQRTALVAGVAALALCVVGGVVNPAQFFRSYLLAYLFWFGLALGCLAILMIHHITGGAWGAVIRRLLESGTRTLPFMALLFVPIALGMHELYAWSRPEVVAHDAILQHKATYLNIPFFLVRAGIYFTAWSLLVRYLNRWSIEQDHTFDPTPAQRMEMLSRGGLLLVGLTMTFASVDWVMSLEPHWASTIYGILFMSSQVVTAMAFVIPLAALLADERDGPLSRIITAEQFHDLGKFLMAFLMLWAYFMLSQFLIIWSGNLPEEIPWYLNRSRGGWQWLGIILVLGYFVLPFLILLSREVKRRRRLLTYVALAVIGAQVINLFWLVAPTFHPDGLTVHWMDVVTLVGVGGVWVALFVWQLKGRSLIAIHDPSLPEHV